MIAPDHCPVISMLVSCQTLCVQLREQQEEAASAAAAVQVQAAYRTHTLVYVLDAHYVPVAALKISGKRSITSGGPLPITGSSST